MTLPIEIGQRFTALVVVNIRPRGKGLARAIDCVCDCGNSYTTDARRIFQKFTVSCRDCSSTKLEIYEADLRRSERQYKANARYKNLEFSLDHETFRNLVTSACFYCGVHPAKGVDRKEKSNGYNLENSVPCCSTCNRAKSNMSMRDFISWAMRLASNQGFSL